MNVVADALSTAIAPFIEQIDAALAFEYELTFRRVVRLDAELADAREPIRRAWAAYRERTKAMQGERELIIKNAANILSAMSPLPVVVTYLGEPVHP